MKSRDSSGPDTAQDVNRSGTPSHQFSPDELDARLREVFGNFTGEGTELMPVLQSVQAALGYLPLDALCRVAEFTRIPPSTVYGVVTFYSQFYLQPQGKYKIKVCQGTACHVRGGKAIMNAVSRKLGISPGETTDDLKFSLERVACFGSCALAPVMVVNDRVYGRMNPDKAIRTIEGLQ